MDQTSRINKSPAPAGNQPQRCWNTPDQDTEDVVGGDQNSGDNAELGQFIKITRNWPAAIDDIGLVGCYKIGDQD